MQDVKKIELPQEIEAIGKVVVNAAFKVHNELGHGLLEKVYEICLAHQINKDGVIVTRQVDVPIVFDGLHFEEGLRIDLVVGEKVIVEVKAVDVVNPVWEAQVISYLKMTGMQLGYVINFHVPLIKNGIRRLINKEALIKNV